MADTNDVRKLILSDKDKKWKGIKSMAKLVDVANSIVEENEDIMKKIHNMLMEGRGVEEAKYDERIYPILYHMSDVRKNILTWYEFKENSAILEIGAGCGIITELLCQKAKSVVAIELSRQQAQINYERNKNFDNLEIYIADISGMKFDGKFDYIVINGAYHYITQCFQSNNPFMDCMRKMQELIKDNGCILFATENRLGTKYIAGSPEKYTGKHFANINCGTILEKSGIFTKNELIENCQKLGLRCEKFYYPYPDYEFPSEIFTDETILSDMYGKTYFQFDDMKFGFIDEQKLIKTLKKERIIDGFSNSFLVVIKKLDKNDKDVDAEDGIKYVKLNSDRNNKYRICTVIYEKDGKKWVEKKALTFEAKEHLKHMYEYGLNNHNKKWRTLAAIYDEKNARLSYPWIENESYDTKIEHLIVKKNKKGIIDIFELIKGTFFENCIDVDPYENEKFKKVFGGEDTGSKYKCALCNNIDIILSNLFDLNGKICVIDYEWCFDIPIPSDYIIWRCINTVYDNHPQMLEVLERRELFECLEITMLHEKQFQSWERFFVYNYVGCNKLEKFLKNTLTVDLNAIARNIEKQKRMVAKLYIDNGMGFSENNQIVKEVIIEDERFKVEFLINEKVVWKQVRFDPTDYACMIANLQIDSDKEIVVNPLFSQQCEEWDVFAREDPNYLIAPLNCKEERGGKFIISGNIKMLEQSEIMKYQMSLYNENIIDKVEIERIKTQNQHLEQDIINIQKMLDDVTDKNQHLVQEGKKLSDELQEIKGSRLYKMYEIKDRIRKK